jgi:hypothetical protein
VLVQGGYGSSPVAVGVVAVFAFDGHGLPFKTPRADHHPFHCSAAPAHANHARCASQQQRNWQRIMSSLDNESGADFDELDSGRVPGPRQGPGRHAAPAPICLRGSPPRLRDDL